MKRLFSVIAAVGIAASGLSLAAPAQAAPSVAGHQPPAQYIPPPIQWGGCVNPTLQYFGAECGMLVVPLDYARPTGEKIKLAVSRLKHTTPDSQYQGITLVNPGGPADPD